MFRRTKAGMMVACLALALTAMTTPAWAKNNWSYWAKSSLPISASKDGGTGHAYGNWAVADTRQGTKSMWIAYLKQTGTPQRGAYLVMQTQKNTGRCVNGVSLKIKHVGGGISFSCTADFNKHRQARGNPNTTSTSYREHGFVMDPHTGSTVARGLARVCLDVAWKTDPCTGWAYSSFDTY